MGFCGVTPDFGRQANKLRHAEAAAAASQQVYFVILQNHSIQPSAKVMMCLANSINYSVLGLLWRCEMFTFCATTFLLFVTKTAIRTTTVF